MGQLEEIYSAEWFAHDFAELRPEFNVVADALARQFPMAFYVADVGCGPGMLIERGMTAHGWHPLGFEGSQHGIDYASDAVRGRIAHTRIEDLTSLTGVYYGENIMNPEKPPPRTGPDLVICTEVAEHLDESLADHLVALLTSAMCPIVLTAAGVGQQGHHHVNCQPRSYWIDKFEGVGCFYDDNATDELRLRWRGLKRLSHMPKNVMVFR